MLALAHHELEERVTRDLQDVRPRVRPLRGEPLDADLDITDRIAGPIAQNANDIALAEPELLATLAHEGADPLPELGALALCTGIQCRSQGSSGHVHIFG